MLSRCLFLTRLVFNCYLTIVLIFSWSQNKKPGSRCDCLPCSPSLSRCSLQCKLPVRSAQAAGTPCSHLKNWVSKVVQKLPSHSRGRDAGEKRPSWGPPPGVWDPEALPRVDARGQPGAPGKCPPDLTLKTAAPPSFPSFGSSLERRPRRE